MTPEDWTGLTDAQVKEKLAEALATIERRSTPHMIRPDRVCDCSFCSSAFAASILASYRASLEAAPVLDAEAGEGARAMADQIVAWSITKQPKLLDEPQAYKAALIRLGAIAGLNYRLHKEPR